MYFSAFKHASVHAKNIFVLKKKRFMIHISCILTGEAVLICHSKVVISLRNNSLVKPALHSYLGKTDVIIYLESVLVLLIADGIKFCTTVYLSKWCPGPKTDCFIKMGKEVDKVV